jgi:predicted HTH domain antitoxin
MLCMNVTNSRIGKVAQILENSEFKLIYMIQSLEEGNVTL